MRVLGGEQQLPRLSDLRINFWAHIPHPDGLRKMWHLQDPGLEA